MGFSKKSQIDGVLEPEGKKWVIAGIAIRASLKPVKTKPRRGGESNHDEDVDDDAENECSTTPTAKEARIPEKMTCPPAPRKRIPALRCHNHGVREFFKTPEDLEAVFIRR